MLNLVLYHVLELLHFDFHDDVVHLRVAASTVLEDGLAFPSLILAPLIFDKKAVAVYQRLLLVQVKAICSAREVELMHVAWLKTNLRVFFGPEEQEFVHDADEGLCHEGMRLVLQVVLLLLAVEHQLFEQLLQQ